MVWLSLGLGLMAWTFAMVTNAKKCEVWMYASFSTCLVAALLPLYELRARFYAGDYGGAEDIIGGIIFGEIVMITVTVLINGIALYRMRKQ